MTHILYDRAANLFMDKISAGYDEMGAHAAVEKKYGIRLADTILGDARAEMKAMRKNPRTKKWDGSTDSGSEYHDLRSRWGLSHSDAVAVIEGRKTFQQVRSEWEKKGYKLEPLYDLRRNPRIERRLTPDDDEWWDRVFGVGKYEGNIKSHSTYSPEPLKNPRGKDIDTVLRGIVNVDYTRGWINEKERDARLKEIKENPRGRHRYLDWKKQTEEGAEEIDIKRRKAAEELSKEMIKTKRLFELKTKNNPRNPNKIEIGKIVDDENGIEKMIVVEKGHPGRTNYRVYAEPTKKGKETKAYIEIRHQLGDDWFSDITDSWWEHGTLPKKMQEKIDKHIEELKALGYTRY